MENASQHHTWINPEKAHYYQVHLDRELFGHWTLRIVWGGTGFSTKFLVGTGRS